MDYLLSVSAHDLFLCLFHFISLDFLAGEQKRDMVPFPSSSRPCSGWWLVPQPGAASGMPLWEGCVFILGRAAVTDVVTSAGGMLLLSLRDVFLISKAPSDGSSTSSPGYLPSASLPFLLDGLSRCYHESLLCSLSSFLPALSTPGTETRINVLSAVTVSILAERYHASFCICPS